jgi:hypothetical protein
MHLYKLKFDSKETPKCQPTSNCKQDLPISQQNKKRIDKINLENIKTKIKFRFNTFNANLWI